MLARWLDRLLYPTRAAEAGYTAEDILREEHTCHCTRGGFFLGEDLVTDTGEARVGDDCAMGAEPDVHSCLS
jgi:hypothetical protein